ncbi:hypothetical protein [Alkaliphilus peptidifermentans]|uniref:Uncharacterized protein n=1 Tax=Alkaliphilus peptidifermentans DSM 18978 TaxID=1120976 RepID=A0A1G5EJM4_9FIRM|nr:hypothetical protein [Alkaliphilus peptidifermentans]SCY26618.1 hypothetical protein SAMN03080606_01166 [Alkaliphilus peptidifermentans DSM 18978]
MSKKYINLFDKEKFAELLDKAKGGRSINKYAEECDISAAHISRFLRLMIETPPTPETISKLSSKAYNDVSYRDLMAAAGHIEIGHSAELGDLEDENDSTIEDYQQKMGRVSRISPREKISQFEEIEKKYFQIILSHLYEVDYKWAIQKPEGRFYRPDMIIDIDYEGYQRWILDFKATFNDRPFMGSFIQHVYGQFAMREIESTDKVTIAVNTDKYYEQFFKRPPKSLRANLYVMLIDLDKGKILKEEQLCSYDPK